MKDVLNKGPASRFDEESVANETRNEKQSGVSAINRCEEGQKGQSSSS